MVLNILIYLYVKLFLFSKKLMRLVGYVKVTVKWHNTEIMLGLQFIC